MKKSFIFILLVGILVFTFVVGVGAQEKKLKFAW